MFHFQAERLEGRYEDAEQDQSSLLESVFSLYQPAEEDEVQAVGYRQQEADSVDQSAGGVHSLVDQYYAGINKTKYM